MKLPTLPQALLAIAAFLAPVMGGYLQLDPQPGNAGLASIFSANGATLAHAIIGFFVMSALLVAVCGRQVIQLPRPLIVAVAGLFVAIIFLSASVSAYKMVSIIAFAQWALYVVGFFAVVACAGRTAGPRMICGGFVLGCVWTALLGLWEYATQNDPTWRIFAHWHQPNALAGILLIGFFLSVGVGMTSASYVRLLAPVGCGVIGAAMLLCQSKGGLLAVLFATLLFFVLIGAYDRHRAGARLGYLFVALLLTLPFYLGAVKLESTAPAERSSATVDGSMKYASSERMDHTFHVIAPYVPGSLEHATNEANGFGLYLIQAKEQKNALSRVFGSSSTKEQSVEFRKNLWKTALALIQSNPVGYGIGTFSSYSAKPGFNTQTDLAHETFLQVAVEASPAAGLLLIALLCISAYEMLRGSRRLPIEQNLFRASVFAALAGSVVHNLVDSDFYMFGIGMGFFLLLGVGLQLSADAAVPEFLPKGTRYVAAFGGLFCWLFLLYAAYVENAMQRFVTSPSQDAATSLRASAPFDPRTWYLTAGSGSPPDPVGSIQHAVALGPSPKYYRALAAEYERQGKEAEAAAVLNQALTLDPNNLLALSRLWQIEAKDDLRAAVATANKLVGIEDTQYFKTRSLPEIVPTETFLARYFLAAQEREPKKRIALLIPAISGYQRYLTDTIPSMVNAFKARVPSPAGRIEDALRNLKDASSAAKMLEDSYRAVGDAKGVADAGSAAASFDAALSDLASIPSSSR